MKAVSCLTSRTSYRTSYSSNFLSLIVCCIMKSLAFISSSCLCSASVLHLPDRRCREYIFPYYYPQVTILCITATSSYSCSSVVPSHNQSQHRPCAQTDLWQRQMAPVWVWDPALLLLFSSCMHRSSQIFFLSLARETGLQKMLESENALRNANHQFYLCTKVEGTIPRVAVSVSLSFNHLNFHC